MSKVRRFYVDSTSVLCWFYVGFVSLLCRFLRAFKITTPSKTTTYVSTPNPNAISRSTPHTNPCESSAIHGLLEAGRQQGHPGANSAPKPRRFSATTGSTKGRKGAGFYNP